MNIFLAQQNYIIGDFKYNTRKIIGAIREAKKQGGDLVVFSELCVCGYPPRDFLEFDDFIQECLEAVDKIRKEADSIAVLIGAPSRNPKIEGKDLFNSAYFLFEREIKQVVHKALLPNYDIFDEYRYFEPAREFKCIDFKGKRLAVTICEDIWDLVEDPLYRCAPMEMLMEQQPDIMINLSASPFDYTHADDRLAVVKKNVLRYGIPMLYCNAVGSQTEIVFDGGSLMVDAQANLTRGLPFFEEALAGIKWKPDNSFEGDPVKTASALPDEAADPERLEPELHIGQIHDALVMGIRQYFSKMGFHKAVVASSGGIDSAVVLALACRALEAGQVRALLLPSAFSSDHSVNDAMQLSKNLGNPYDILPIKNIFETVGDTLSPLFKDMPFNVAEENIQARVRGLLAMAVSNKFGNILLNTSNKSELAVGYGTLYGDMAGGLGVLGDVYKMQVYALARYINRDAEIIPGSVLTKAPSAELRPGQQDSDSLPDYAVLDAVLYQYIERRKGPKEIVEQGFERELVNRILQMVNRNEYKRGQFCPIIRVSPKSFGIGRRMPIVGKYLG